MSFVILLAKRILIIGIACRNEQANKCVARPRQKRETTANELKLISWQYFDTDIVCIPPTNIKSISLKPNDVNIWRVLRILHSRISYAISDEFDSYPLTYHPLPPIPTLLFRSLPPSSPSFDRRPLFLEYPSPHSAADALLNRSHILSPYRSSDKK